jgi:hypothetical protein
MIFGFGILATALLLSIVAAYYSVAGLTAIFSAATIPVIIMGGSLRAWQDCGHCVVAQQLETSRLGIQSIFDTCCGILNVADINGYFWIPVKGTQ